MSLTKPSYIWTSEDSLPHNASRLAQCRSQERWRAALVYQWVGLWFLWLFAAVQLHFLTDVLLPKGDAIRFPCAAPLSSWSYFAASCLLRLTSLMSQIPQPSLNLNPKKKSEIICYVSCFSLILPCRFLPPSEQKNALSDTKDQPTQHK